MSFDAAELAVVLSYYDLGLIESVTDFVRGSRWSPKVGIVSQRGKFLLKRRSPNRAHPDRVRFVHRLQTHLADSGYPVAKLIPTRDRGQTFVHLRDHIYELFEFIAGHAFQQTAQEARDAGVTLARFHQITADFITPSTLPVPHGDYHDAAGVRTGLCSIGSTLSSHDSFTGDEAELAALVQFLLEAYDHAAETVNGLGCAFWPRGLVHADWHPGNLLFRKQKVIAVIDYDSVRLSRRALDAANGALQFSILAGGDPAGWPDGIDTDRFRAFLSGYQTLCPLLDGERDGVPYLMAESLVAECVPPITQTGSVGRWAGYRVLGMVKRKLKWLMSHVHELGRAGRS